MPTKTAAKTAAKTPGATIDAKGTRRDWQTIEEPLTPEQLAVNESLILKARYAVGDRKEANKANIRAKPLTVLNGLYLDLRYRLEDAKLVSPLTVAPAALPATKVPKRKVQKPAKVSKADAIRTTSALAATTRLVDDLLQDIKTSGFVPNRSMNSPVIEIRGIGLIHMVSYIIRHQTEYSNGDNYVKALSLIVTVQRFLDSVRDYQGQNMVDPTKLTGVSTQLLDDLQYSLNLAEQKFPFNGITIAKRAPELTVQSQYDKWIPSGGIAPRQHQADIIDLVANALKTEQSTMILNDVMIGGGKTTGVVGVIEVLKQHRNTNPTVYGTTILMFCCSNLAVKSEIARLCFNSQFPFAIGSIVDGKVQIVRSFNCATDADILVVICSPEVGHQILATRRNQGLKTVLFLDEPTTGADNENSAELKANVAAMKEAPVLTILASATMPDETGMVPIVESFKIRYPTAVIMKVTDSKFSIPSTIQSFTGQFVTPILGCQCPADVKAAVNVLKTNPFLRKSITVNTALDLAAQCMKHGVSDLPSIAEEFKAANSINIENVMKFVINVLNVLATHPSEVITVICAETKQPVTSSIDITMLATKKIVDCPHLSLIAHPEPDTFALEIFATLLTDMEVAGFGDATEMFTTYDAALSTWKTKTEKALKSKSRKYNRDVDGEDAKSNEPDDLEPPKLGFPLRFQVGTLEHVRANAVDGHSNFSYRNPTDLTDPMFAKLNVPNVYILLLLAGIGIYHPESKALTKEYLDAVMELAASNKLMFLVANHQIAYGVNFAIYQVFITDEYARQRSLNSIFQLMGRAGRVGKSWKARIVIGDELKDRMLECVKHPETVEADNIARAMAMMN